MDQPIISAQRVREVIHYCQHTGVATWRIARGNVKAGAVVGWIDAKGYRRVEVDGRRFALHRLIWFWMRGEWPIGQVDHENGMRADNRWLNLRDVTHAVNQQNQRLPSANNTSGYLGVSWDKSRCKWVAQIRVNNHARALGRFDSAENANLAYLDAKRKFHPGCTI